MQNTNWSVYALRSINRKYIYVGMSSDVPRRIKQHNEGHERTTRAYRPFRLIFSETLPNRLAARDKEKWLKSGIGKEFLKSQCLREPQSD
jgi:putative endonuclease